MAFSLLVISPPVTQPTEISAVIRLFENGLNRFHLRKPEETIATLEAYLEQIPAKHHRKIVIHSHYSLAEKYKLHGIHLTEEERKKNIDRPQRLISSSFHSLEEMNTQSQSLEYTFLSPVFDSISKKNYKSTLKWDEVLNFLSNHKNIYALGGIDKNNILKVREAGFKGAGLLGAIWKKGDPVLNYLEILSKVE